MNATLLSADASGLAGLAKAILPDTRLEMDENCRRNLQRSVDYLKDKIAGGDEIFYGINTGFGDLCTVRIDKKEIRQLQHNLVKSHACGTGEAVPAHIVRLIMVLKIRSLCRGYSGVRPELVERLVELYNADCLPVIYQQGSLGASGDLAPLAHLSLPLIGMGEVTWKGERMPAEKALQELGLQPLELEAKEGLALLNGTQFSTAYGCHALLQARRLLDLADTCAALSLDAFDGDLNPFHSGIHRLRPHQGQVNVAGNVRRLLRDSEIGSRAKTQVQDPYAFRCVPQVHGASRDALTYVEKVLTIEADAVTDNPNILPDEDLILSGGNFHAQPVALALDFLSIALAEIGSISERRVFQLLSGKRGLPAFLAARPGLHSGMMIAQYTAASIVSQNKQLCTPASVDSIVSSNGQEDHVSMAANAGTKLYRVVENIQTLLAIEWMVAAQAMDYRRPARTAESFEQWLWSYRQVVPSLTADRPLSGDIQKTNEFLQSLEDKIRQRIA